MKTTTLPVSVYGLKPVASRSLPLSKLVMPPTAGLMASSQVQPRFGDWVENSLMGMLVALVAAIPLLGGVAIHQHVKRSAEAKAFAEQCQTLTEVCQNQGFDHPNPYIRQYMFKSIKSTPDSVMPAAQKAYHYSRALRDESDSHYKLAKTELEAYLSSIREKEAVHQALQTLLEEAPGFESYTVLMPVGKVLMPQTRYRRETYSAQYQKAEATLQQLLGISGKPVEKAQ